VHGVSGLDPSNIPQLLDLAFDFACGQPVSAYVDPAKVLPALELALEPERALRWQTRMLVPLRARLLERASRSAVTLNAWLPADAKLRLAELLGAPVRLPRAWIEKTVASEGVRDSVKTLLSETLTTFLKGGAAGTGVGAAVGLGARALGSMTKSLLGGLGEGIQTQLQERVRDFVDTSVATVQRRIVDIVAGDDVARALGQERRKAFLAALEQTERDVAKQAARTPFDTLDALAPRIVAHNLARAEVREAIEAEVREALAELSQQTLGEVLDDLGLRTTARATLHARGRPWLRAFAQTPEFAAWWASASTPRDP